MSSLQDKDIKFYVTESRPTPVDYELESGAIYAYPHDGDIELFMGQEVPKPADPEKTVVVATRITGSKTHTVSSQQDLKTLTTFQDNILHVVVSTNIQTTYYDGNGAVIVSGQGILLRRMADTAELLILPDGSRNNSIIRYTWDGGENLWSQGAVLKQKPDYAHNADKLTNARTITLIGDVEGSFIFDGSTDATVTTSVKDDSHKHNITRTLSATAEDLDFLTTTETVAVPAQVDIDNKPFGDNAFILEVLCSSSTPNRYLQKAYLYSGSGPDCKLAYRTKLSDNDWSSWVYSVTADKSLQLTTNENSNSLTTDTISGLGLADRNHASTSSTYGVGTASYFGHVKLRQGVLTYDAPRSGEAAASYHTHSYPYVQTLSPTSSSKIDLNDITSDGFYALAANDNFSNAKAGNTYRTLHVQTTGNNVWQTLYCPSYNKSLGLGYVSATTYVRCKSVKKGTASLDWSEWAEVITYENIQPSIDTSGTQVKIKVGGKSSTLVTIPYATKAEQDADGNTITRVYATKEELFTDFKNSLVNDGTIVPAFARTANFAINAAADRDDNDIVQTYATKAESSAVQTNLDTLKNQLRGTGTEIFLVGLAAMAYKANTDHIDRNIADTYLTKEDASTIYLEQSTAAATYATSSRVANIENGVANIENGTTPAQVANKAKKILINDDYYTMSFDNGVLTFSRSN